MALSIPKIITNSSTGVIVYTSADLARAFVIHGRSVQRRQKSTRFPGARVRDQWDGAKDGALFGNRLEGVFGSRIRKILFKLKTFFLEKFHMHLS